MRINILKNCRYRRDYYSAKKLNSTFRLIDDITSINSDGIFKFHADLIYPKSLILNKENTNNDYAHVLDLNIHIVNGTFNVSLYDKREDFPFKIVQFIPEYSNMPSCTTFGVFGSQLVRYFRIINSALHFKNRITKLVDNLDDQL